MTELEAWRWLSNQYEFCLVKPGNYYQLNIPGMGEAVCDSVLDCVIEMKGRIGE